MSRQIAKLKDVLISGVDILVIHCPPYGILDQETGKKLGNIQLSNLFYYNEDEFIPPKMLLCGHFHNSHGVMLTDFGMEVYNSATIVRSIQCNILQE